MLSLEAPPGSAWDAVGVELIAELAAALPELVVELLLGH
jgi:hypothetical protein